MPECQICGEAAYGINFGVQSCKACASFFRRTVVADKKHTCRTGRRNCVIYKSKFFKCRWCRFERCRALGMMAEKVRRNSAEPTTPPHDTKPQMPVTPACAVDNISPIMKETPQLPFISQLLVNFRKMDNVMKCNERAVRIAFKLSPNLEKHYPTTFSMGNSIAKANAFPLTEFLFTSFPVLLSLSPTDRENVVNQFIPKFCLWQPLWFTAKCFEPEDNRYMMSQSLYLDLNNATHFFDDEVELKNDRFEMIRVLVESIKRSLPLTNHIRNMQLNEVEFIAVTVLLIWSTTITSTSDELFNASKQIRSMIFRELREYYRSNCDDQNAERFGELIWLLSPLELMFLDVRECVTMCKIFDFFTENAYIKQIFEKL